MCYYIYTKKINYDRRNDFTIININESYETELGFELAIPESAVRRATDCAIAPGCLLFNILHAGNEIYENRLLNIYLLFPLYFITLR